MDEPAKTHVYDIGVGSDGRVTVLEYIGSADERDDLTIQSWQTQFATLDEALAYSGRSRVEPDGSQVKVLVDGKPV
jgi:hypothetical protein